MKGKIKALQQISQLNGLPFLLFCAVLFLSACAGSGFAHPRYKLATVESSIATAKENKAHTYAPMELNTAEEKFRAAEAAIARKKYGSAHALLDEALLDAKHAEAKSEAERAKERVTQTRETIDTLRYEMQINR